MSAQGQVGRQRTGKCIEPEAEDSEFGQVSDSVYLKLPDKAVARKSKSNHTVGRVIACYAFPRTWRSISLVPQESSAADGST